MKFVSSRRFYLDKYLNLFFNDLSGKVIDIGGKKNNKRGSFSPSAYDKVNCTYLNIDEDTNPDIISSAENIPLNDSTYDAALLIELLEHVENPTEVLKEAYRILKDVGTAIDTMPFLYPVHSDPDDFQRWTKSKIENEIIFAGFTIDKIDPMGGLWSVIFDLLRFKVLNKKNNNNLYNRLIVYVVRLASKCIVKYEKDNYLITTGWVVFISK